MLLIAVSLVCIAVAFVAGWLMSKIYLAGGVGAVSRDRLHSLLQAQRDRYRKRIASLYKLVRRHERRREEIEGKLKRMNEALQSRAEHDTTAQAMLEAEQTKTLEIENELGLLKIQRDALAAKVDRRGGERRQGDRRSPESHAAQIEQLRGEVGSLREELSSRDHAVRRLEIQLQEAVERERLSSERLSEWKKRVQPLTHQLRLQRDLIRKLKDDPPEPYEPYPTEVTVPSDPLPVVDERPDDLKKIRGIGPALERRLQAHGISRYNQIAEMSHDELARIAEDLAIAPNLPSRDQWIEQARQLHRQGAN